MALAGCGGRLGERLQSVERQLDQVMSQTLTESDSDAAVSTFVGSSKSAAKIDQVERRMLRGIEARLRGADARRVLNDLAVDTPADLPSSGAALDGMRLQEIVLTPAAAPEAGDGHRSLAVVLHFEGSAQRSLYFSVASRFFAKGTRIEVTDLTVKQVGAPSGSSS